MNYLRYLSDDQKFYLHQIGSGKLVITFDPDEQAYRTGGTVLPRTKNFVKGFRRRRSLSTCRWPMAESVIELLQLGLLVDENGRLVPGKEARRQFGAPPPIEEPERPLKMSRTRAARDQDA